MDDSLDLSPAALLGRFPHHIYVSPFLEHYGQLFIPQPLPRQYRRGEWRACFKNSFLMATKHRLTYVEGIAYSEASKTVHLHAWCVSDDGKVLDRTWSDGRAYLGVPFQTSYIRKAMADRKRRMGKKMFYGFLDDYQDGMRVTTTLAEHPGIWLAQIQVQCVKDQGK